MEIVLQYLDDLDDFFAAIGLLYETIRSALLLLAFYAAAILMQLGGVWLAIYRPPMALAAALLLCAGLLIKVRKPLSR